MNVHANFGKDIKLDVEVLNAAIANFPTNATALYNLNQQSPSLSFKKPLADSLQVMPAELAAKYSERDEKSILLRSSL